MVTGRTHRAEGRAGLAAHHRLHGRHPCAGRMQGGLVGVGIHQRVGIYRVIPLVRRMFAQTVQILDSVHAQQVMARCLRRLPVIQIRHQSACQQLVGNGIQPLRAFGMPTAHFMQAACRVSKIHGLHKEDYVHLSAITATRNALRPAGGLLHHRSPHRIRSADAGHAACGHLRQGRMERIAPGLRYRSAGRLHCLAQQLPPPEERRRLGQALRHRRRGIRQGPGRDPPVPATRP
ncbi:hypothetical protein G6F68_014708 [Rhizopus microsporus]|nr:hypothetical protein G6F68_014708 [Rhizopus microsporus]